MLTGESENENPVGSKYINRQRKEVKNMSEFRKIKSLKFLYEVNRFGVVRNVKSKKIVKGYVEKNGYVRIKFENKCLGGIVRTTIHRLVAEAFIPNPNNLPEVNHIDRNRANNCVENLEWCTHSENMKHSYNLGINQEPLRNHSKETRRKVTNGTNEFESIIKAAEWLVEEKLSKNQKSAISGISAVVRNKIKTFGGYSWKYI